MGAIEDTRKLIQDFIAPELREVGAKLQALAEGQKAIREDVANGHKALIDGQKDVELRLLREIVKSEERISLLLKVADLSNQNAELTRRPEEKKNSPSSAQ
jgi:hypothetical protein